MIAVFTKFSGDSPIIGNQLSATQRSSRKMITVRGFSLGAALFSLSISPGYAHHHSRPSLLVPANSVISVRTTAQAPVPNPANLSASFASNRYTLTINSAAKNDDGVVGINFPQQHQGKFPIHGHDNFVDKFVDFSFDMGPGAGQPSDAAFPFAVTVQDQNDGFYHVTNGNVTSTGNANAPYRFRTPPASSTGWVPAFQAPPFVRKLALTFSGDFVTPVKSVQVFVTADHGIGNPFVNSSDNHNDIPNAFTPPGGIDFSYNLSPQSAGTPSDTKFNFDTASNN